MTQHHRRSYGTGNLRVRRNSWYGQWWIGDRRVQRKLGPVRQPGTREGLTRKQAEGELRRRMQEGGAQPRSEAEVVTFAEAATEYLRLVGDVRQIGARTLADYRGVVDGYLLKEFGDRQLEAITPDMIDHYKEKLIRAGNLSSRTIVRHLTVLHG